jgi:flagellar biosynthetic protein FliR
MEVLWDLIIYNFVGCLLVFSRVLAIFTFNPIFARQNVPPTARVMMSVAFAVCILAGMGGTTGYIPQSVISFIGVIIVELLIGFVFGFFVNLILTVIYYAGEATDRQIGFAMASVMDPGTGMRMPVIGNMYYIMFVLYFFITGAHLEYIRLFYLSYEVIPIGFTPTPNTVMMFYSIVMFLGTSLTLAMKLFLPVLAAGLITEACIGVIMKSVPTIQIFILNFQLKILLGMFVIFGLAVPISDFIDNLMSIMMESLGQLLYDFI